MTTVAIIQARMGSHRLPGKVLAQIGYLTAIEHVVRRVLLSKVDQVIVAAPVQDETAELVKVAAGAGARVFLAGGAATDVLGRYARCIANLEELQFTDVIVRITADCPFIQPDLIDAVVANVTPYGFASNIDPARTFPDGLDVEAFTVGALLEWNALCQDPAQREHVTAWWRTDPTQSCGTVSCDEDLSRHRWTLDTPDDLRWFQRIAEEIDITPPHPTMDELLELIGRKPELAHYA